jgi:hypothetical protein
MSSPFKIDRKLKAVIVGAGVFSAVVLAIFHDFGQNLLAGWLGSTAFWVAARCAGAQRQVAPGDWSLAPPDAEAAEVAVASYACKPVT